MCTRHPVQGVLWASLGAGPCCCLVIVSEACCSRTAWLASKLCTPFRLPESLTHVSCSQ